MCREPERYEAGTVEGGRRRTAAHAPVPFQLLALRELKRTLRV